MNASQLLDFTYALQLSDSAVIWCVNVLLQVTLVAALALATSACFRRISAIRYGILCCGLGLSLLCPLSVLCLQTCGVGLIAVSLQSEPASSITNQLADDLPSLPSEDYAGSVNTRDVSSGYKPSQKLEKSWPREIDALISHGKSDHAGNHEEFGTAMESLETGNAERQLSQLLPVPPNLEATANSVNRWTQIARVAVPPLIVVWLAVSMALLLRLAVGWSRVIAILRDARPSDDSRVRLAYRRACDALNVPDSLAQLRISRRIAGPLAAGWRCPQIVLPETLTGRISSEQLHEILVHEVAHIVRRDQIIVLLQNVTNAIYWFHPLARRLNRSLAQAREEVCDNYVLNASDAPTYSRTLLTVAEMTRCSRPLPGTVGLFTSRWKLESRVAGLLDTRRDRMTKLSCRGILLVTSVAMLLLGLASAGTMTLAVADGPELQTEVKALSSKMAGNEPLAAGIDKAVSRLVEVSVSQSGGAPVSGAQVAIVAGRVDEHRGPVVEKLAQGTTNEEGKSNLELSDVSSSVYQSPYVIAYSNGFALSWQSLDLDRDLTTVKLELTSEQIIQVRLVDIEGQPVSNATVGLSAIYPPKSLPSMRDVLALFPELSGDSSVFPNLRSDATGLITIPRIPEAHGVRLRVTGNEQVAPQGLMLNTGAPESRESGDSTYRDIVKNLETGEVPKLVLAPAQFFAGRVLLGESEQPAAHATIRVGSSQQRFGSTAWLQGQTDADGRFRICPYPGLNFSILADAPAGSPYHVKSLRDLKWESGVAEGLEIHLSKGVMARGTIVDAESNRPINGASIQYIPHEQNEFITDDVMTGWQGIQKTDAAGDFAITVPPGRGHLLVHAPHNSNYVLQEAASRELSNDKPGGVRMYAHAFEAIEPGPDLTLPELTISLQPGTEIVAKVVDSDGIEVDRFITASTLQNYAIAPEWPGWADEVTGGKWTVRGLPQGRPIPVAILHPERKLGTIVELRTDELTPTIQLQPCGQAIVRFIDEDGQPKINFRGFGLHMVVTAGRHKYLSGTFDNGEFFANETFVVNFDRHNHGEIKTDAKGEMVYPALIPGLTYRLVNYKAGEPIITDFVVEPGQTKDLGEMVIESEKEIVGINEASKPDANSKTLSVVSPAAITNTKAATVSSEANISERPFVYSGRVLTPDGKPAKGANVRLVYWFADPSQAVRDEPDAIADDQGHFQFAMRPRDFYRTSDWAPPWHWASLAVTAEGYGLAWASSLAFEVTGQALAALSEKSDPSLAARLEQIRADIAAQNRTLRLVEETLIHGKVINTEGEPVPNIRVRLVEAFTGGDDSLNPWLEQAQQSRADFYASRQALPKHLYGQLAQVLIANTTTDARGSYTIRGLGVEQLVRIVLQSPKTVTEATYCITRNIEPFELNADLGQPTKFHATHPVHVAVASRPIQGVVLHETTGESLEGVLVSSRPSVFSTPAGSTKTGSEFDRTLTDARGRFTLTGLPNVSGNSLYLTAPMTSGVLPRLLSVDTSAKGLEPHELEVKLVPGTVLSGRVTDAETGSGVAGHVQYLSASDLPSGGGLLQLPMAPSTVNTERADLDGNFQIAIPAGPGYLAFRAFDEVYEKRFARPDKSTLMISGLVQSSPANGRPEFHALEKLDIGPDFQPVELQLNVHRGKIYSGKFTTADGKVVESGFYYGFDSNPGNWRPFSKGLFSFVNYKSAESRQISVVSEDLKWSATYTIHGEIIEPPTIELQPAAMVTGRIVDKQGNPLANLQITEGLLVRTFSNPRPTGEQATKIHVPLLRNPNGTIEQISDEDGRFTIHGLVAGSSYDLSAHAAGRIGNLVQDLTLKPGEVRDLGTIELKRP